MPSPRPTSAFAASFWLPLLLVAGGLLMTGCGATAPVIGSINTPDTLETDESGRFRAVLDNSEDADRPLRSMWRFGDGTTASGREVQHSYDSPGRYNVRYRVRNEGGADTSTTAVTVVPKPIPPRITSINATPNPVDEGESVRFTANVQGTAPLTHRWRFGDGESSPGRSPRHTYLDPGRYTVRLQASNEVGEDMRTLTVRINRVLPTVCTTINELNTAYFERNSSTLTDPARTGLAENADVLSKCPNLQVRIEGFAAPNERSTEQLSQDRARAVAAFYRSNQVPAQRIRAQGRGRVENAGTEKGEERQFRRVDSIPQRQGR